MILLHLFLTFFKIGLFTIGGGYAMIPLIQEEVRQNHWLSSTDLIDFIAVSESTPGPFAVNIATYIRCGDGGDFWGAVCATAGVVLPSFLIILLAAKWFLSMQERPLCPGSAVWAAACRGGVDRGGGIFRLYDQLLSRRKFHCGQLDWCLHFCIGAGTVALEKAAPDPVDPILSRNGNCILYHTGAIHRLNHRKRPSRSSVWIRRDGFFCKEDGENLREN